MTAGVMVGYVVLDDEGMILRRGTCHASMAAAQGARVVVVDPEEIEDLSDTAVRFSEAGLTPLPPPGPEAVAEITPRQLFIALASPPFAFISAEEAVAAAARGEMPAIVEATIAGLDAEGQMAARVTWARMQSVERANPLVAALAAAAGLDAAALDAFFAFAAGK